MKRTGKALWLIYAVVLCFGFFQTTAKVSALSGFSEGQYVLLNGGLLAGLALFVVLPAKLIAARKKTGRRPGKKAGRMHGRRRGGVCPAAVCTTAFCLAAILAAARMIGIPSGGLYLGEHSGTVFFWNLFCQTGGSVLAFAALISLSGFWSAVFMMAGVIVLSPLSTGIYVADPQNFLLLAAGAELLCLAGICRMLRKTRWRGRDRLFFAACSFLCGVLCLADVRLYAFLLLLPADFLGIFKRRRKGGTYGGFFWFLTAAAAGFFAGAFAWCMAVLDAGSFGGRMGEFLEGWLFMTRARAFPVMLHSPLLSEYIAALGCYLAAFLPLFFGSAQRTRGAVRWILPFLALFAMEEAAGIGLQGQALRFLALSAMAGAAVTGIFAYKEPAAIGVIMKRNQTALENAGAQPAPGEYLDNPLPVPKRHVRKEMNYGFEPAPEQMYYEIPVADNDDFDV